MTKTKHAGFMANTLRLIFGNAGAQAINLLTIPIITRLYAPDSYGVLTLFLSVSSITIAISCLRLETVILLPEKKEDAVNVFLLCIFFVFLFTFLIAGFSLVVNCTEIRLPESYKVLKPYLYLMAGYIFLAGSYKALSFIAVRQDHFTIQALSRVSNAGFNKLFSILYGIFLLSSPAGLIGGLIIGNVVSCWLIIRYSLKELFRFITSVNFKSLINTFIRYKSFQIYSGVALIESVSREMVPLMFGFMFGPAIVGLVGLATRVIQQPLSVLGDSISRSFFQKITAIHRTGNEYNTYVFGLFKHLFIVTFIPLLLLSIISPEVFEIIFGAKWRNAGVYFSILSLSFFSGFLYRPFSIIFDVQEKQRLRFLLNVLKLSVNTLAICCGAYLLGSSVYAMILYSAANTILTFSMMFLLMYMAGVTYISLFAVVIKQILIAVLLITPISYIKFYTSLNAMFLFSITGLCIALYFSYIYIKEPEIRLRIDPLIKKFKK